MACRAHCNRSASPSKWCSTSGSFQRTSDSGVWTTGMPSARTVATTRLPISARSKSGADTVSRSLPRPPTELLSLRPLLMPLRPLPLRRAWSPAASGSKVLGSRQEWSRSSTSNVPVPALCTVERSVEHPASGAVAGDGAPRQRARVRAAVVERAGERPDPVQPLTCGGECSRSEADLDRRGRVGVPDAGAGGQRHGCERGQRAVEVVLVARAADESGAGRVDQPPDAGEPTRGDLVVGIEEQDPGSVRPPHPGGACGGDPGVLLSQHLHPAVGNGACSCDGVIRRAVVDHHDLDAREGLRQHTRHCATDHIGSVVHGDHDAEAWTHRHSVDQRTCRVADGSGAWHSGCASTGRAHRARRSRTAPHRRSCSEFWWCPCWGSVPRNRGDARTFRGTEPGSGGVGRVGPVGAAGAAAGPVGALGAGSGGGGAGGGVGGGAFALVAVSL